MTHCEKCQRTGCKTFSFQGIHACIKCFHELVTDLSAEEAHDALQKSIRYKQRASELEALSLDNMTDTAKLIEKSLLRELGPSMEPSPSYAQLCCKIQQFYEQMRSLQHEIEPTRNDDEQETEELQRIQKVLDRLIDDYGNIFENVIC